MTQLTPVIPVVSTTLYYTKRQFVLDAFAELALAGYVFDLSPEMLQQGLRRLDAMLSGWYDSYGLDVGYPLPVDENTDLDNTTTVPYGANTAVVMNLAVSLAAGEGVALKPSTVGLARDAFDGLLTKYMNTPRKLADNTAIPAGAGYKGSLGTPFLAPDEQP